MRNLFSVAMIVVSALFVSLSHAFAQSLVKVTLEKNRLEIGESTSVILESHFPEHQSGTVFFDINEGSAKGTFSAVIDLGQGKYMTSFTASQVGSPIRIAAYINGHLTFISDFIYVPSSRFDISKTKLDFGSNEIKVHEDRLLKVFLNDEFGNPLVKSVGGFVSLTFVDGDSVISNKSVLDNGDGTLSLLITGVKAGSSIHPRLWISDQVHTFTGLSLKVVP